MQHCHAAIEITDKLHVVFDHDDGAGLGLDATAALLSAGGVAGPAGDLAVAGAGLRVGLSIALHGRAKKNWNPEKDLLSGMLHCAALRWLPARSKRADNRREGRF
mgnify:CR=1 FL=1